MVELLGPRIKTGASAHQNSGIRCVRGTVQRPRCQRACQALTTQLVEQRPQTYGRPVAVMSVAVPIAPIFRTHKLDQITTLLTACPLILCAGIPILPIESEREEIPVYVHCDTSGSTHSARRGEKSGDGEQRGEHIENIQKQNGEGEKKVGQSGKSVVCVARVISGWEHRPVIPSQADPGRRRLRPCNSVVSGVLPSTRPASLFLS